MRLRQRLTRRFDSEPALAFLDGREATARAGDRCADLYLAHVMPGADHELAVARLPARLDRDDFANVCNDAGEHFRLPTTLAARFPACRRPPSDWNRARTGA